MIDRADYVVRKFVYYTEPMFRVYHKDDTELTDHFGKAPDEESFILHFRHNQPVFLELSWPIFEHSIEDIKQTFFPNSELAVDEEMSGQITDHDDWYTVTLSDADRMWFELAAQ